MAISNYLREHGLLALDTEAQSIYVCSQQPASYAEASSTYKVGGKTWSAGGAFGSPTDASPTGRKVTSTSFNDGSVTATATASKWAVCDDTNQRLLADGDLSSSIMLTNGYTFSLASFEVIFP